MEIRYVDLNEGELAHFKYLKREKLPNGKWRYYYAKDNDKIRLDDTKGRQVTQPDGTSTDFYLKNHENGNYDKVSEKVYTNAMNNKSLFKVGDRKLSDVVKEQTKMGANFVKDLLSGNVELSKKKKTTSKKKNTKKSKQPVDRFDH